MDSTLISGKHFLFAYCITDGILDEISPEQRTSIIRIIESLLSEEDAISESLLSGGDASACSKKKKIIIFFLPVRLNNSLLDMTPRTNRVK